MKKIVFMMSLFLFLIISVKVFAEEAADTVGQLRLDTDILWTCLAAFLVFFMQAGFAMVESGFTRAKNAANMMTSSALPSRGIIPI